MPLVITTPFVVDLPFGNIYFGTSGGDIHLVDAADGSITNTISIPAGGVMTQGLDFDGEHVVAVSSSGFVYKYTADLSTLVWTSPTNYGASALRMPSIDVDGNVYIAGTFDSVKRLRASDGVEDWEGTIGTFTTPGAVVNHESPAKVATVVRLSGNDTLEVYESGNTGSPLAIVSTIGSGPPNINSDVIGFTPTAGDSVVVAGTSSDTRIRQINATTGTEIFNQPITNDDAKNGRVGFDSDGNIYTINTDPTPDRITKYNSSGVYQSDFSVSNLPQTLAVSAVLGALFIGMSNGRYARYTLGGSQEWELTFAGLPTINGVACLRYPHFF